MSSYIGASFISAMVKTDLNTQNMLCTKATHQVGFLKC